MLISGQAKDLVKICVEGGGCMSPFQPLVYIRDLELIDCQWVEKSPMWRFMWRKREFYGVIWRCFARVKCGNIMSGFGSVVIAAKVIYCVIYRKCWQTNLRYVRLRILCVKHKNASWVFSLGDFVLESLFCAQRLWILNLFLADTELWPHGLAD